MVLERRVDDLFQLLDYRLSLQHERADTRVLFDLDSAFALRECLRLSHEPCQRAYKVFVFRHRFPRAISDIANSLPGAGVLAVHRSEVLSASASKGVEQPLRMITDERDSAADDSLMRDHDNRI